MLSESPSIAAAPASDSRAPSPPSYRTLLVLFACESAAINLARLPESMRFDRFAFCDQGANLSLQYLVGHGLRPTIDFGYPYGLLPVLVGRIWFAMFGATPWAYQAAMLVSGLLCAWAIARTLSQLKIGTIGIALAFIAFGYAYQASFVNFAHAIEAILLSFAICAQASGSRSRALAFAAVAVYSKPSMGYVYGLVLVVLIARDSGLSDLRRFIKALAPAAIVFVALAITMWFTYGAHTLARTIVPLLGTSNYRAMNYGLMGVGRQLWDPTRRPWIFYVIDVAGFWILSGIFLFAIALLRMKHVDSGTPPARRYGLIVTCAILHLAFLVLFFGNQWSWVYYSYILIIGTAIAVDLGPNNRRIGVALTLIAAISYTDLVYGTYRSWSTTTRDAVTAGLWAPEDERNEWLQVLALAHEHKVVMLDTMGAAELLFPGFDDPANFFVLPGMMQPGNVRRKLAQLSNAQVAVVPVSIASCGGVPDAPEFKEALKSFDLAWTDKHMEVFRRRATP